MRPRGPLDALTSAVEDVTATLRRRRHARALRVRLYDEHGQVRALDPTADEARPLVEAASALLDAVAPPPSPDDSEERP